MGTISRTPSIASQKHPLPHVSALIQSAENRTHDARKTLSSQRTSKMRSASSSPKSVSQDLRSTPNIHLLAGMPDFYPQDLPPVASHGRRKSSGVNSPASKAASVAGDSIFELPTPMHIESPNSSVAVSFVAELEDTSESNNIEVIPPLPYKSQHSPASDSSVLFKPNKLSALLKVVDETIAGLEAANRELLARAEAAEASAYRLHVSNTELRSRIEELSEIYRPKPPTRSIAVQTSPSAASRHSSKNSGDGQGSPVLLEKSHSAGSGLSRTAAASVQIPSKPRTDHISSSRIQQAQVVHIVDITRPDPLHSHPPNNLIPQEPQVELLEIPAQPKSRRSIRSLRFLQRHHAENLSQPLTPSSNKAARQSSDRPRTADNASPSSFGTRFEGLGKVPPMPELPIFLSLSSGTQTGGRLDDVSSVSGKEDIKRGRRHTRTLSFEEAKKIAAQSQSHSLPKLTVVKDPLGEMSPSPIHGVVEIGLEAREADKDDGEEAKPLRSQRSRVRFLLKESGFKELLMEDRRKDREKERRKVGAFFKWGKRGEEVVSV